MRITEQIRTKIIFAKSFAAELSKTKNGRIIIGAAASALCVLSAVICAAVSAQRKIDLNRYISVSCSGYDGYGTAAVEFDIEKFREDYSRVLRRKGIYQEYTAEGYAWLMECLAESGELSKKTGISNGDEITYELYPEEENFMETFGIGYRYRTIKIVADGLAETETFDAFADITYSLTGYSGNGKLSLANTSGSRLTYTADKTGGISNGDVITVKVSVNGRKTDAEDFMEECGAVPEAMSMEVTVSGLGELYSTADERLKAGDTRKAADDIINAAYPSERTSMSGKSADTVKYAGYIFFSNERNTYNGMWYVYEIVSGSEACYDFVPLYYLYSDRDGNEQYQECFAAGCIESTGKLRERAEQNALLYGAEYVSDIEEVFGN